MNILFAGGGTAGHINPALAIANHMKEICPDTNVHFVGTKEGLEASLIPHSGYGIDFIKVHGFERKLSFSTLKTAAELPAAVAASKKIIRRIKPDAVVGTGGYVCGPVLYAAAKMGIPTLVHESNAFPGITTKILSKYVDEIAIGIDDGRKFIPNAKQIKLTGNPVRPSILQINSADAKKELGVTDKPFIVIFGGSLGARDFNKSVVDWISSIAEKCEYRILMGTGKLNQYKAVTDRFKENGKDIESDPNITVSEYIYNMDVAMNAADLVISRAGASTLAELTAIGKPAILVPSPYVTDNHQEHNARAIERGGGAVVLTEAELSAENIDNAVKKILSDKNAFEKMASASAEMGVRDSADRICKDILKLIKDSKDKHKN